MSVYLLVIYIQLAIYPTILKSNIKAKQIVTCHINPVCKGWVKLDAFKWKLPFITERISEAQI